MNRLKKIFAVLSATLALFTLSAPTANAQTDVGNIEMLIPGGMAFGLKMFTDGAVVLGTTGVETASGVVSPAKDSGLQAGDVIIRAGGQEFETASDLISLISGSGGKSIVIAFIRNNEEKTVSVTPARDSENGTYRIGVLVRDSTAGIGTVTYIDPETQDFGGLGHGVYDNETGILLPMSSGDVVDVVITDVVKSEKNSPGELHGSFGRAQTGELWDNCEEGVFGRFLKIPKPALTAIPVATKDEITKGKAHILTTISENGIEEYEIEVEHIYNDSGSTKNFLVKITDEELLSKTGGIVQGMSGSPIIQDGKLIGAITHVCVNL